MKTAIVYDYIPANEGGGERALYELIKHFAPDIHIFFAFAIDSPYSRKLLARLRTEIGAERVHVGLTVKFFKPIAVRLAHYLLPALLQHYNFQPFELVISFTAFLAHTIVPPVRGRHVVFMNTPARFLWNLPHAYSLLKVLTAPLLITDAMQFRSRLFDLDGIYHLREIWANSDAVAERIHTFYNRQASVLYPPSIQDHLLKQTFETEPLKAELGDFLMYMGRVESFKNLDLLIDAYQENKLPPNVKSVIVGDGPYLRTIKARLRKLYGRPKTVHLPGITTKVKKFGNVYVTGYIPDEPKLVLAAAARGFLSLNDEDFGITKVEALAVGTPIVAWRAGGARDVVQESVNGIFFERPSPEELGLAVTKLLATEFHKPVIRHSARRFTTVAFHANLDKLLYA